MITIIRYALELIIILMLLKVSFSLVVVVVFGFVRAIPSLVLTVLALLILDKFIDDNEEEE